MVTESEAVVAPYHRRTSCRAADRDAATAFTIPFGMASFWSKPIQRMGGSREVAKCELRFGLARRTKRAYRLRSYEGSVTAR